MDLQRFLELANKWQDMGNAVQRQLQDVVDGQGMAEQNPNALRMIARFLNEAHWDVDEADNLGIAIAEFLETSNYCCECGRELEGERTLVAPAEGNKAAFYAHKECAEAEEASDLEYKGEGDLAPTIA